MPLFRTPPSISTHAPLFLSPATSFSYVNSSRCVHRALSFRTRASNMGRDESSADFLRAVAVASHAPPAGSFAALRELYDAVSPDMPRNLSSSLLDTPLPLQVRLYTFDEGHAGRLSVPGTAGGSAALHDVMAQVHPFTFIRRHLTFRAGDSRDAGETVLFVPGLNTLHQPREKETSSMQRCEFYVKVLGAVGMAQLHMGTSFDQGDVVIDASKAPLLRGLVSVVGKKLPEAVQPSVREDGAIVWDDRKIDNLQTGLSALNLVDTPVKAGIRELLDTTLRADGEPFVLMVYSRGSIECAAALRKYEENSRKKGESKADLEKRLRERVTVVTIGNASRKFLDGPAYIHLAARSDPLVLSSGVSAEHPNGAGADAVFLSCDSPYSVGAFDNHNFGAVTSQYLALVLALNKTAKFREVWDMARAGELHVPAEADADAMTRAMIRLTRGDEWLWNAEAAWKDVSRDALPSMGEAEKLLREKMGEEFVGRVLRRFDR